VANTSQFVGLTTNKGQFPAAGIISSFHGHFIQHSGFCPDRSSENIAGHHSTVIKSLTGC